VTNELVAIKKFKENPGACSRSHDTLCMLPHLSAPMPRAPSPARAWPARGVVPSPFLRPAFARSCALWARGYVDAGRSANGRTRAEEEEHIAKVTLREVRLLRRLRHPNIVELKVRRAALRCATKRARTCAA
jgi:hypothetical protein